MIHFLFIIVVIFNYGINNILAENNYYIIGIKRSDNDENYDKASKEVQKAVNILVNERMNDIYDIIGNNKDTYILENGKMDEVLNELNNVELRRRNNDYNNITTKYSFINKNRRNKRKQNKTKNQNYKPSLNSTVDSIEYIPIESVMVSHICPITNYYAITAYLSDEIVEEVRQLPNIIFCEKSYESQSEENSDGNDGSNSPYFYYNLEYIQKETNWTGVSVQENDDFSGKNLFSHLSLISQSNYHSELTSQYDNNFYYPSSAGKGIDIFLIDAGIYFVDEDGNRFEDYDQYAGTSDERIVSCDAIIVNNEIRINDNEKKCRINSYEIPGHGNMVASMAGGKIFGVAKKANIHMLATGFTNSNELLALDYIAQNGTPHKTVISISRGGWNNYSVSLEDKINELVKNGFIIFVSAGNNGKYCCSDDKFSSNFKGYSGYKNTIAVGASENIPSYHRMEDIYKSASYSNYGECVFIHAPDDVIFPPVYSSESSMNKIVNGFKYASLDGTSCSTPLVAGVAATIMSEHPEIEFNTELIKKYLEDLSLKDVLQNLMHKNETTLTPNRFINNGKRTIFSPVNTYNGCGVSSGGSKCNNGCCSENDHCIPEDTSFASCYVKNGCQSEFGTCYMDEQKSASKIGQKCGPEFGSCIVKDEELGIITHISCCSKNGICDITEEACNHGCQIEYGFCSML